MARVDEFVRVGELDLLGQGPDEVAARENSLHQDQHVRVYLQNYCAGYQFITL